MQLILNSDVIYSENSSRGSLPSKLAALCQCVKAVSATLAIPRTAYLENTRQIEKFNLQNKAAIASALNLLQGYGATITNCDPEKLALNEDIVEMLKRHGYEIIIIDPTLEDYQNAERRASLHLSPLVPDTASDEMRDLVIWECALRLATQNPNKTLLVSSDKVHSSSLGEDEAEKTGLLRAKEINDAIEMLGEATYAGKRAREILEQVLPCIVDKGIGIPDKVSLIQVLELAFSIDRDGYTGVSLKARSPDGKGKPFRASLKIHQKDDANISVSVFDIVSGKERSPNFETSIPGKLPKKFRPIGDRLSELKQSIQTFL